MRKTKVSSYKVGVKSEIVTFAASAYELDLNE